MDSNLRIIVTELIAQHYQLGGVSWDYLNVILGFKRLGHDVYYYEDSGEWPYKLDGTVGLEAVTNDSRKNVEYLSN